MKTHFRFTALLTYINPEEGGRSTPVSSGYRPSLKFPFGQGLFTAIQKFIGTDLVFPGDTVNAEITLPEVSFAAKLYEGLDFEFYEGGRLIGYGTVTALNDTALLPGQKRPEI